MGGISFREHRVGRVTFRKNRVGGVSVAMDSSASGCLAKICLQIQVLVTLRHREDTHTVNVCTHGDTKEMNGTLSSEM